MDLRTLCFWLLLLTFSFLLASYASVYGYHSLDGPLRRCLLNRKYKACFCTSFVSFVPGKRIQILSIFGALKSKKTAIFIELPDFFWGGGSG